MGILATAEADIESILGKVDLPALMTAASSLVAAWPSIEGQIEADATQLPQFVAAIEKALTGATPADTDWAALDATLDANDADIAVAGAAAQAQIDQENGS